MKIALNRLHYPVTSLGPGRRIGLWLQGCSIRCPGCASRDTWQAAPDRLVNIDALLRRCAAHEGVDGVTISGGEPFEQPTALAVLLDGLDAWRREVGREIDLLCYSGLPWRRLQRDHGALLDRLDAIVPEPFVERLATEAPWRGSANQKLIALSALGRRRYSETALAAAEAAPTLQVAVEDGQIWLIGIPRRGDLDRLVAAGREKGISMGGPSWRS